MSRSRLKRFLALAGILSTFFASGPVCASDQWPFPHEAYPQDLLYCNYVLYGAINQSDMNHEDKTLGEEQLQSSNLGNQTPSDESNRTQEYSGETQYYDYWEPDKYSWNDLGK